MTFKKEPTELVRMKKKTKQELTQQFPGIKMPDLIDIMYNSSALKVEALLKQSDFANNLGEFVYGKRLWKKKTNE